MKQSFQSLKQSSPILDVRARAVVVQQPKSLSIRGAIRNARIETAFGNLLFAGVNDIRPVAIDLIFPSRELRLGKPPAQAGDDFFRGNQFSQQRSVARGKFAGFNFSHFPTRSARPDFAKREIADCGGVKHSTNGLAGPRFQARAQIRRGCERLHMLRAAFARISRLLADEQRDVVPMCGEKISEFGAELPGGKIRNSPRAIERFVGGSCGHKANHGLKIMEFA